MSGYLFFVDFGRDCYFLRLDLASQGYQIYTLNQNLWSPLWQELRAKKNGGEGGIRTHGPLTGHRLATCCFRPLSHLSSVFYSTPKNLASQFDFIHILLYC